MQAPQSYLAAATADVVAYCRDLVSLPRGQWCPLVMLSAQFIEQERFKGFVITTLPSRAEIAGELVRVDLNSVHLTPVIASFVKAAFIAEFCPSGEGVGGILCDEGAKSGIIVLRDVAPDEGIKVHASPPLDLV